MITLIPTLSRLFTSRLHPDEWVPDMSKQAGGVRREHLGDNYASVPSPPSSLLPYRLFLQPVLSYRPHRQLIRGHVCFPYRFLRDAIDASWQSLAPLQAFSTVSIKN